MTNQISAGGNVTIEIETSRWRLLSNGYGEAQAQVEAIAGQPLRYLANFGASRRLPDTGVLPTEFVRQVVLGWSLQDESWHLGLMLGPELARVRGSRWCEMAHWPDPDADLYRDIAQEAGQTLAQTMARPFSVIPPETANAQAPAPPRPLPNLPLRFDLWTVEDGGASTVKFKRSPSWGRSRALRVVWYAAWAAVYFALSIISLQGGIAPPKPEFLPYLGLASGVVLVGMVFYLLYQLLTVPREIVVDGPSRNIRAMRGNSERWRIPAEKMKSVYISQIVGKRAKNGRFPIQYGELNMELTNGEFRSLVDFNHGDDKQSTPEDMTEGEKVAPLIANDAHTDLQAAALHVAKALDLPCFYDRRTG